MTGRRTPAARRRARANGNPQGDRPRPALPPLTDVGLSRSGAVYAVELVTTATPTDELVRAARRALCQGLPGASGGREPRFVEVQLVDEAMRAPPPPAAVIRADPFAREVLAAVVTVFCREHLERRAEQCLWQRERETMCTPEDLVQSALLLLLSGTLVWRGSLDALLRSLCCSIHNLSRDDRKVERKLAALEAAGPHLLRSSHDTDREWYRVLLAHDVEAALRVLAPREREAAVRCLIEGERAAAVAADRGGSPSTVRTQVRGSRERFRTALAAYAPLRQGVSGGL
jgi:DNA-directed RNA polymerase specialized sigma24 family protein